VRYMNMLLCLLMVGFAAVQYNDPDALLWIVLYMIPAVWAFLAAFRLTVVRSTSGTRLLWTSVAAGIAAVIFYWPEMPGFWRQEVFTAEETAREGMGVMIALMVLLVALFSARRASA
jgi:hypothetical protein